MNGTPETPKPPLAKPIGAPPPDGKSGDAVRALRARHAKALQSGPGTGKGSGQLGRARGPYKKPDSGPDRAGDEPPAPSEKASQESVNRKMGMVWRSVGMGAALASNCNVYLLDTEQEKMLGEAYGDLCAYFGLTDTLAFKVVFAVGITVGVFGIKVAQHSVFLSELRRKQELQNKTLQGDKPSENKPMNKEPQHPKPGEAHETKPGEI